MDASHGMASQLAELVLSLVEGLKQGSPDHRSVHPEGRAAGVGLWERRFNVPDERARTIHSV